MAPILVVCTGNVCRSPIAEGYLRSALMARFGAEAPVVESAGTAGWQGSPADPGSVAAAAAHGVDISTHRARRLLLDHLETASLVLAMAAEHRDAVAASAPRVAGRTFTLKELVRLLEALPEPRAGGDPSSLLAERVAEADRLRRSGFAGNPRDQDVADPLGMSDAVFFAVAYELDEWCRRLAEGLFGKAPARAAAEGE
ncbi:MAG TPA: low molecular weight phosphatase family protein [Actinomycetota bacterium]|nr:low molecular weight phosphatase family protein [Actinomycetota bacterium]